MLEAKKWKWQWIWMAERNSPDQNRAKRVLLAFRKAGTKVSPQVINNRLVSYFTLYSKSFNSVWFSFEVHSNNYNGNVFHLCLFKPTHLFAYLSLDFPSFCRLIEGRDIIYCPSGQLCEEFSFSVSYIVDNVIENFPLDITLLCKQGNRFRS